MKIRRKLLIAFSIYMILALIPAVFAYRELNTLKNRLKPVEAAGDISGSYLELRKIEKTFLLLKDRDTLQLLKKQISIPDSPAPSADPGVASTDAGGH